MSKIRYINYEDDIFYDSKEYPVTSYNLLTPIVHKRNAFAHESELRIFQLINEAVDDENYWESQPNYIGKNISCNIESLISNIILPPTSDKIVYEKVRTLLNKYCMNVDIEKSKLNDKPVY
jgi:hypothetical protein